MRAWLLRTFGSSRIWAFCQETKSAQRFGASPLQQHGVDSRGQDVVVPRDGGPSLWLSAFTVVDLEAGDEVGGSS
jgi:hypothetical protein